MFKNIALLTAVVALTGCASVRSTIGEGATAVAAWANAKPVSLFPAEPLPIAKVDEAEGTGVVTALAPTSVASAVPLRRLPVVDVPADANTARLMTRAMSTVSLRTLSLETRPQSLAMLQRLCATKGVQAEVVVYDAQAASPEGYGCVRVYVSKSPAMGAAPDLLVVDAMEMFARGISAPADAYAMQREVELRQELKYAAVRVN